jgi:opacity protein-like surface antigen
MFFLRGGYKTSADEGGLGFGAGANINLLQSTNITLDYAYSDLGILKNSHRFTISLSI